MQEAPAFPSSRTQGNPEPGRVWCVGDWAKIDPQTGDVHGLSRSRDTLSLRNDVWDAGVGVVQLRGVRNEFLAFQIVIESLGPAINKLLITAQDFEGPTRMDAARSVQFFRELYLPVEGKWYPDALLPFDLGAALPLSVPESGHVIPGQRVAVVWVDIYIPAKGISAGTYEATFKVSYRSTMQLAQFTVRLEVLDLTLPDEISLDVDLMNYGYLSIARGFPDVVVDSSRYRAIEREFYRVSHAHRTTFAMVPYHHGGGVPKGLAPPLRGTGERISVAGWTEWDARFGPFLDGSAFADLPRAGVPVNHFFLPFGLEYPSAFRHWGTDRFEVENRNIATEFIYHLAHNAWIEPKYLIYYNSKEHYGFFPWNLCEPTRQDDVEALLYLSNMIRSAVQGHPGVRAMLRLDVGHFHCTEHEESLPNIEQHLRGYFDLWNIDSSHWNERSVSVIREFVEKDEIQAWFYSGASRVQETLQAMHDYPWLAWKRGAHGICFWNATDWLGWDTDDDAPDPYETVGGKYRGASMLLYPGSKYGLDGPIVSMRLKALRRGLQEYELLRTAVEQRGPDLTDNLVNVTFPCRPQNWGAQRNRLLALFLS